VRLVVEESQRPSHCGNHQTLSDNFTRCERQERYQVGYKPRCQIHGRHLNLVAWIYAPLQSMLGKLIPTKVKHVPRPLASNRHAEATVEAPNPFVAKHISSKLAGTRIA